MCFRARQLSLEIDSVFYDNAISSVMRVRTDTCSHVTLSRTIITPSPNYAYTIIIYYQTGLADCIAGHVLLGFLMLVGFILVSVRLVFGFIMATQLQDP